MPVDKWGIPFWYPTADNAGVSGEGTGFFWQQNNDIMEDNEDGMVRFGKELEDQNAVFVIDEDTGEFEFPFDNGASYFCMELRQGHKSGGESHGCEGSCYICNVTLNDTPAKFYFQKQMYHGGSKFEHETGKFTSTFVTEKVVGSGWKGFAAVVYDKKDGRSTGHDSAILEIWWNEDPVADIKNWVMIKRIEDKGGWGTGGDTCDGVSDQVITWSNIQFRYKSGTPDFSLHPLIPEGEDDPVVHSIGGADMSFSDSENRDYGKRADMPGNVEMKCLFKFDSNNGICRLKNLSLREIDPTKTFDDVDPQEPPTNTTTVQGTFTFKQDINHNRISSCAGVGIGGGGGSGATRFYSVYTDQGVDSDKQLSDSTTWDNRKRIVMSPANSSSIFVGKIPEQLDIPLKKVGTPTTPNIFAKIWNSAGAVVYTSPTTIDPATLTTSYVKKTFDFSTNTHALVVGDRIGVEWTGTSSTSYVVASYKGTSYTNTNYYQYENTTWESKTRRLVMDVWE
jgi:hypothetical protein